MFRSKYAELFLVQFFYSTLQLWTKRHNTLYENRIDFNPRTKDASIHPPCRVNWLTNIVIFSCHVLVIVSYIQNYILHWKKIPIKIIVLAQYSCSIFIFLLNLYCRRVKNMVYHIWNEFTKRSIKFHTQHHIF